MAHLDNVRKEELISRLNDIREEMISIAEKVEPLLQKISNLEREMDLLVEAIQKKQ